MGTRNALLSVYHKDGIVEFAKALQGLGFNIIASGGTAKELAEAGIDVTNVASLVGGGPILGHRVVTLSREVHAGLLAKDNETDRKELERLGIPFIDLVCVDTYPLAEEVRNPKATLESVIEKTDIGGPTMIVAGAKGLRIVICKPTQRAKVLEWLKQGEPNRSDFILQLIAEAAYTVSSYYQPLFNYTSGQLKSTSSALH